MVILKRIGLALWLSSLAPLAHAHGSVRGLGAFMGGFLHPLLEPAQLVALIALLLLVGQQGTHRANTAIWALIASTATGLVVALNGWVMAADTPLLMAAALTGLAVTVARPLPVFAYLMLGAAIGLGIGLGFDPQGLQGAARIATAAGTWMGTGMYVIGGSTAVVEIKPPWARVLIRVVGSWMTACAVLVLALHGVASPATLVR